MSAAGLAATHAAAFGDASWPTADFARYLDDATIFIAGDESSFAVFRVLGPEAEVLTLATHPSAQGKGKATAMLHAALTALKARGVEEVFLDVAEDNTAARALYARTGFQTYAERRNYYRNATTAVCMKACL